MLPVSILLIILSASAAVADDARTVEKVFRSYAGNKDYMTAADFALAISPSIPTTPSLVSQRIYPHHDLDGDGALSFQEFAALFPTCVGLFSKLKQAHLSLAEPGTMWITWVTDESVSMPSVRWGASSHQLHATANGSSHTFAGWNKTIHQAKMSGLPGEASRVYYQYGHAESAILSEVQSFATARSLTARLAIQADQGTVEPLGNRVAQQIARDCKIAPGCDAMHIVGDLAYAWKSITPGPEEQWIWDLYMQEQQAYALSVPFMATAGNHEQFENATSYLSRFRMPGPESGGKNSEYFSYNVGPVHMVAFTTDGPSPCDANSEQYNWLIRDLAAVNRSLTPWVVFTTHRPMYCSSTMEYDQHAALAELLEPVLLQHKVDLAVFGHVHVYERVYPNVKGNPVVPIGSNVYTNPSAPAYVVQGTGGCLLNLGHTWNEPAPQWSAVRTSSHYGYGMLDANSTGLRWRFLLEADGSVFDEFSIIKQAQ